MADQVGGAVDRRYRRARDPLTQGPDLDWGALLIIAFVTVILAWGTKLSAEVSLVITVIKVAVVLLVVIVGAFYIKTANYSPFIPPAETGEGGSGTEQSHHDPSWPGGKPPKSASALQNMYLCLDKRQTCLYSQAIAVMALTGGGLS